MNLEGTPTPVRTYSPEPTVACGFPGVACINCGEADHVSIDLETLQFTCSECDETYDLDAVRAHLASWHAVVVWVELAPPVEG